jgi:RNA polymerase sigma-70 factor (ECF subfamily)
LAFLRSIRLPDDPEEKLLSDYRTTGDPALVGKLFEPYMELVYGVCLKYLKNPDNAQDSVMAIFEELLVKLKKHEVNQFRPWLHTLARNHCLMKLRSEKRKGTVNMDVEFMQSEEEWHLDGVLEKEENLQRLDGCLEQLPPDQKKAIELFYLEGKSYHEIAAITGMEWNQVRSFIQNGRRNLKICMEGQKLKTEFENGTTVKK